MGASTNGRGDVSVFPPMFLSRSPSLALSLSPLPSPPTLSPRRRDFIEILLIRIKSSIEMI